MSNVIECRIYGRLDDPSFHKARLAAEANSTKSNNQLRAEVKSFTPAEWELYLDNNKASLGVTATPVVIFTGGHLLKGVDEFMQLLNRDCGYTDVRPYPLYKALANTQYKEYLDATKHSFYFLDIAIEGKYVGKLVFELFDDLCPRTCANFAHLCTGDKGVGKAGYPLHYKNSAVHRIVPGGWIQAGDICGGFGDSGESIYGDTFSDENFILSHSAPGILGMANKGPHTNASQFYVTLRNNEWMNTKHVAFGKLIDGFRILKMIEELKTENQRPFQTCAIVDCGKYNYK